MSDLIERTLILCKHDSVQRGLVGEIINRFEQRGFKIVGIKMITPTEEMLGQHYPDDPEWKINVGKRNRAIMANKGLEMKETDEEFGHKVREWNKLSLRGDPLVAIAFQGYHAVEIGRKIVGHTDPSQATPGTIRGDFSVESFRIADAQQRVVRNVVHASGSVQEAEKEIKVWFKQEELCEYDKKDWAIMHSFNR